MKLVVDTAGEREREREREGGGRRLGWDGKGNGSVLCGCVRSRELLTPPTEKEAVPH